MKISKPGTPPFAARSGALPADHVPDVLAPGLALVFCGTALGRQSAIRRAYYANPGNFFWRTLHEAGFTPQRFAPADYAQLLPLGIGLTDLCKTAYGNDDSLTPAMLDRDALEQKILRYRPAMLAFTSKAGAAAYLRTATGTLGYGLQAARTGDTAIYVLPSPSGLARSYWDAAPWQALAEEYLRVSAALRRS